MSIRFDAARFRLVAMLIVASLALNACASSTAYDPGLSPAQNQLRQSNARFNTTVAEGAGAGALLGGLAGLALGGRNRGQAALIGAGAGAVLGGGAGYLVARNNLSRASTEAQFNDAIQQASAEADRFRSAAQASQQIADDATADVRKLNGQLRAGQITQAQYRTGLSKYQADNDAMTKQISEAHKAAVAMRQSAQVASGANRGQFTRSAAETEAASNQMEQTQARLSRALAGES